MFSLGAPDIGFFWLNLHYRIRFNGVYIQRGESGLDKIFMDQVTNPDTLS